MYRVLILFFFSLITIKSTAQEVFIDGVQGNRELTWTDFTGKVDKASSFDAYTFWKLNYSYTYSFSKGDTVILKNLTVKLEFDPQLSWVKKIKATNDLLKHEQGHFNIGLLCQQAAIKTLNNTVYLKGSFENKIKSVFSEVLAQYVNMTAQYDKETNHSKNIEGQKKWDEFFIKNKQ